MAWQPLEFPLSMQTQSSQSSQKRLQTLKKVPTHSRVIVFKKRERERKFWVCLISNRGPQSNFDCFLACFFTRKSTLRLHLMKHEKRERTLSATRHFPHFMNPETTWKRIKRNPIKIHIRIVSWECPNLSHQLRPKRGKEGNMKGEETCRFSVAQPQIFPTLLCKVRS